MLKMSITINYSIVSVIFLMNTTLSRDLPLLGMFRSTPLMAVVHLALFVYLFYLSASVHLSIFGELIKGLKYRFTNKLRQVKCNSISIARPVKASTVFFFFFQNFNISFI